MAFSRPAQDEVDEAALRAQEKWTQVQGTIAELENQDDEFTPAELDFARLMLMRFYKRDIVEFFQSELEQAVNEIYALHVNNQLAAVVNTGLI